MSQGGGQTNVDRQYGLQKKRTRALHFLPRPVGVRPRPSREAEIPIWSSLPPSLSHCRQPLCHGEPSPRPGLALAFMVRSREGEKSRGKTWCGRSWMPTTIPLNKSIHYPTSPTDSLTDRCACCLLRCEGTIYTSKRHRCRLQQVQANLPTKSGKKLLTQQIKSFVSFTHLLS